uniref:Cytochrome P450 n=1 Tax=Ditylenchus dipsaci TaxID=166011 RepID=A0A915D0Q6_9BILA
MFGYGKQSAAAVKTMKDTSTAIIKERIKAIEDTQGSILENNPTNKKKMAFLDLLLSKQDENKMPFELLRDQVDTFMFGGHDTTTQAIAWTLWSLACHPDIQERLYQELFEIYGVDAGEISSSSTNQSKYLDRCIKESMRVFSPVPMISRALNNDMEIGGKLVPSGSVVAIASILIHHNYLVYKDHDVYNPDNFLPEECAKRHAYDYIPFSAGPRNCIGQKFQLSTDYAFHANGRSTESVLVPQLGVPVYLKTR